MRLYADLMSASDAPCCSPNSLYGSMTAEMHEVYKVFVDAKERKVVTAKEEAEQAKDGCGQTQTTSSSQQSALQP